MECVPLPYTKTEKCNYWRKSVVNNEKTKSFLHQFWTVREVEIVYYLLKASLDYQNKVNWLFGSNRPRSIFEIESSKPLFVLKILFLTRNVASPPGKYMWKDGMNTLSSHRHSFCFWSPFSKCGIVLPIEKWGLILQTCTFFYKNL